MRVEEKDYAPMSVLWSSPVKEVCWRSWGYSLLQTPTRLFNPDIYLLWPYIALQSFSTVLFLLHKTQHSKPVASSLEKSLRVRKKMAVNPNIIPGKYISAFRFPLQGYYPMARPTAVAYPIPEHCYCDEQY